MRFSHDRRGQSVVVGVVILFGFLIVAMAVYQAQVVPQENANVEFEHSQEVENDVNDLRNTILRASTTGSAQPQRVRLGTRYPQRTFFVNPAPATGDIRTTENRSVEFDGIEINESAAHENVVDFWTTETYTTRSIQYESSYNEFRESPRLTYEHSVVGAEFPNDATLFRTNQTVVRGDRLSLTMLSGSVSENGVEARNLDPEAVSEGTRTVPVDVDPGDAIVLPTALNNETRAAELWNERLERLPATANATEDEGEGEIRIEFDESGEYRLRLSEVSMDGTGKTESEYIVPVGPENVAGNTSVGVEVRDKYNNPVEDAEVAISDRDTNRTTGDDGRVFFTPDSGFDQVDASIRGDPEPYENVTFTVTAPGEVGEFSRVFDVQWDNAGTTLDIDASSEESGTVRVDGDPLDNATVDFSTTDPSVVETEENSTTTEEGEFNVDLIPRGVGNATVYAASGDDVDRIPVEVNDGGNGDEDAVWVDCPVPPSPPDKNEDGVRFISSSPTSPINAGGDTVVIEDGISVSTQINNPGDVFIGTGASVSSNIGASGVIVLGENAQISGNVNDGTDFYLLPGSSASGNVGVSGTIYLDDTGQVGGNINSGTVQECTIA